MNGVQVRSYRDVRPDTKEILRYARAGGEALPPEAEEILNSAARSFCGRVVYAYYSLHVSNKGPELGFTKVVSPALCRNLAGCDRLVLFCATAGHEFDRLARKYEMLGSPAKALWCHAIGAAWAESVCDAFCADVKLEYGETRPRFSPGYGGWPLSVQADVFAALEPQKHIGVALNEKMIMTPSKSVTAVVGIKEKGL